MRRCVEETLQLLQQQNAAIQQQNDAWSGKMGLKTRRRSSVLGRFETSKDFFQGEILRRLPDPTTMQGMVHQDSPRESVLCLGIELLSGPLDARSAPGTLRNTIEATVQATLKNKARV